jgi:hypothetical protein
MNNAARSVSAFVMRTGRPVPFRRQGRGGVFIPSPQGCFELNRTAGLRVQGRRRPPKEGDLVSREAVCSSPDGEGRSAPGGDRDEGARPSLFPPPASRMHDIPFMERGAEPRSRPVVFHDLAISRFSPGSAGVPPACPERLANKVDIRTVQERLGLRERGDDDDLRPCIEWWRPRGAEPAGPVVTDKRVPVQRLGAQSLPTHLAASL